MAKQINTYRLTVDYYKPYKHGTHGGYDVGAKDPKEAVYLLQRIIGFGSVQVLYGCTQGESFTHVLSGKTAKLCGTKKVRMQHTEERYLLSRGEIKKVGSGTIKHECDPLDTKEEPAEEPPKRSFKYGHDKYIGKLKAHTKEV